MAKMKKAAPAFVQKDIGKASKDEKPMMGKGKKSKK